MIFLVASCEKGWVYQSLPQSEEILDTTSFEEKAKLPVTVKVEDTINIKTLNNRAISLFEEGKAMDAYLVMNESLRADSAVADSYYIRGVISQKAFNIYYGLDDFEKAIELNPNHVDALLKCGIIYGKQGNKQTACDFLNRACKLGSEDACQGVERFCN